MSRPSSVEALRRRLREQQETLDAIRSGAVDALVVTDPKTRGEKLFTLQGADFAFQRMLEQMGEGAASAYADGTIIYCNRAFARLFGRPLESVMGADLVGLLSGEARLALAKALHRAVRRKCRLELSLGAGRPILLTLTPLSAYEPRAVGILATDLRLHARNLELEERVQERTAALQAANRELEAFNYSVSHDLKAPARQLSLYSEMLERDHSKTLGPEGLRIVDRIRFNAARLSSIINGMLELSRATLSEPEHRAVDLTALARSIVEELRRADPGRSVTVRVAPGMTVRGDEALLRLALHNLLANAWKFTSSRKRGLIDVRFHDRAKGVVRVKDNGVGFDMAFAAKLFQPFQRLHKPEEYPGTGIGLSIVQRVLARHGGRVWAAASVGRGAAFYFQLGKPPRGGKP